MKRVTVFCGSSLGNEGIYHSTAACLGETLANQHIELVFGGARVGLMGTLADSVLKKGGKVIGVLPHFLKKKEIAYEEVTELILVNDLHERKARMNELSDGFIALPGGFGTLDELFEILTMAQLGLHTKPVAILNIVGFYDALILQMQLMVDKGFLKNSNFQMLIISDCIEDLLDKMKTYNAPVVEKWIH